MSLSKRLKRFFEASRVSIKTGWKRLSERGRHGRAHVWRKGSMLAEIEKRIDVKR
jgi:hypothetical protein